MPHTTPATPQKARADINHANHDQRKHTVGDSGCVCSVICFLIANTESSDRDTRDDRTRRRPTFRNEQIRIGNMIRKVIMHKNSRTANKRLLDPLIPPLRFAKRISDSLVVRFFHTPRLVGLGLVLAYLEPVFRVVLFN
jgi:hypothetical protein